VPDQLDALDSENVLGVELTRNQLDAQPQANALDVQE
jgi:hypothetical protein